MKRTHPAFWGAGWAGVFVGVMVVIIGLSAPPDLGSLAGGYGLMLIGSALFLLAGLRLREHVSASAPIPAASRS